MDVSNLPALPPPLSVRPQFDHPGDTVASPLRVVNEIFVSLTFIAVGIRLVMCGLAIVGSIVHTALCLDSEFRRSLCAFPKRCGLQDEDISIGYGLHFWDIRAISLNGSKIQVGVMCAVASGRARHLTSYSDSVRSISYMQRWSTSSSSRSYSYIIRPSRELPEEPADSDVGLDFGWRHGLLFLPLN
ncbi:hypothetical protein P154DRAFT_540397 [Amniculicola lignicola CBS 123094]|uniref:Uncharacterized protein n=1 Tax=Amniculicola lignicola CBS 123094 TaxID=1392246 RepID=A0A6A5VWU9_9PLEO|nr:hypothetical protein P154DRAFT_540397 [Amniculicola lignicola CBS 123094]